jgi:repressor LexA
MTAPSPRQRDVMNFVAKYADINGYAPSVADICQHFGWVSKHAAACHIDALVKKGLAERTRMVARSLRLTSAGKRWLTRSAA